METTAATTDTGFARQLHRLFACIERPQVDRAGVDTRESESASDSNGIERRQYQRRSLHYEVREIAGLSKVSHQQIANIRNGATRNPAPATLAAIAHAFGVHHLFFYGDHPDPRPWMLGGPIDRFLGRILAEDVSQTLQLADALAEAGIAGPTAHRILRVADLATERGRNHLDETLALIEAVEGRSTQTLTQ